MTKETYYFSHDYNTRSDPKIKKLLARWGYPGYGVFWGLIEDLYQNANALPLDYECIAFDMRSDRSMIKSIINDFGLFVIEGDSFGSFSVQRRLEERAEKSEKARQSAFRRWGTDANAMRTQCDSNAIKERKGKKIKVNDNNVFNFKNALIELGVEKNIVEAWLLIRKKKKAVNTEIAFKAIKKQIELSGATANDCITKAVEKSWAGFEAEWFHNSNSFAKKEFNSSSTFIRTNNDSSY